MVRVNVRFAAALLVACGAAKEPAGSTASLPPVATASTHAPNASVVVEEDSGTGTGTFTGKIRDDLTECYEVGRKAVPEMTSGKVTFHIAVDAGGKTACVVPADDTGLTQDVENCMRTRLDQETYAKRDAAWSFALPIVVKDGKLGPGEARANPPSIETIESHGLAEDVYDVVERLLPDLYACVQGIAKSSDMRMVTVGARVGSGGAVECALASAPTSIPAETRACTAKVLGRAKFRPPKKGYGLVSVPLNVMSRK